MAHEIHISVVSHGHGQHMESLLGDLANLPNPDQLQLTLTSNIPESLKFDFDTLPFPCRQIHNTQIASFSRNHNQAFEQAPNPELVRYFLILNPDVRVRGPVFTGLAATLEQHRDDSVALVGPAVVDAAGQPQSNGRVFPDFGYLLRKLLGSEPENPIELVNGIAVVDWVAGMCMLLRKETFASIGGFDEKYRLYYEDVDLCLRLCQQGLFSALVPQLQIEHEGQWQSRSNITHLSWHCRSVIRFLGKMRLHTSRKNATHG